MIPRPPRPTLFPYTTLFRSSLPELTAALKQFRRRVTLEYVLIGGKNDSPEIAEDRKSTRLNSSHLGISYAVFCLKKKNHRALSAEVVRRPLLSADPQRRMRQ